MQVAVLVELKARFDEATNVELGQGAGARRRPRGLRPGRAEDPRQVRAGRARGRRRAAPLLPHRHRQLQLEDRPPVRGPRLLHLRPRRSAPTSPSCSTTSPATAARTSTSRCWWRRASMRNQLLDLIEHEIGVRRRRAHHGEDELAGRPAADRGALRGQPGGRAIDLIIRGICCLRARGAGASARTSGCARILGRYLEHSRISASPTARATGPLFLIGSADWMPRNLDRRVEVLVPVCTRSTRCGSTRSSSSCSPTTSCAGSSTPRASGTGAAPSSSRTATPGALLPLGRRPPATLSVHLARSRCPGVRRRFGAVHLPFT